MFGQRMLKDIPIIGSKPQPSMRPLLLLVAIMVAEVAICSLLTEAIDVSSVYNDASNNNGKHPVFFSEYKLRSTIETANAELRQLKRDFVSHMTDIYFGMKSDPTIGVEKAKSEARPAAIALSMMAEQFGDIVVKRHIIQRRLLAGLKVAFVKFLPLRTLKRLMEKFPSYSWLKSQSQVDLRPKFPDVKENQFVKLYTLIDLRARLRAADDISTLTSDNIRRILRTIQWFLVERKYEMNSVDSTELYAMSRYASRMTNYYLDEVIGVEQNMQKLFDLHRQGATRLFEVAGGETEFWRFVDTVIDAEALDIHLNNEANSLEAPPTINEQMIDNVERKWIPAKVLESIYEDRSILLKNKAEIKHLVKLNEETSEIDLPSWLKKIAMFLCGKTSYYY